MADEIEIVHVDVGDGLPPGAPHPRRVVAWLADAPVAYVDVPAGDGHARPLADAVAHRVAEVEGPAGMPTELLGAAALRRRPEPVAPLPAAVTVVIRSAGDAERLQRCRAAIGAGSRTPDAVVVSRPDARTEALGAGGVIAFVEEALEPHRRWLERLCAPFADPDVAAVAGLVLERGPVPVDAPPPPLGAGPPGAEAPPPAATLAVRADAVTRVGPWDERLTASARDAELWGRLHGARWRVRHAPEAIAFHDGPLPRRPEDRVRAELERLLVAHARSGAARPLAAALLRQPASLASGVVRELGARARGPLGIAPLRAGRPLAAGPAAYLRGLSRAGLASAAPQPQGRAPLPAFLARNPFPHPLTEGFFYREKMRAIHRVAPDVAARSVLEVGGGRSGLARLLYPAAHVTTIDMDPEHASAPVHRDPLARFLVADATDLPFPDASFDVVTMLDVLEHIPDDRAAASEAWRVLKPGGHLLASSPNERWRSPYHRVMAPICPGDEEMIARWVHVRRGYTIADYAALFGRPPDVRADFINPVTAVCHDLAFSHLPSRARRALCTAIAPATWLGYALQPRGARGTESAVCWRKPAA